MRLKIASSLLILGGGLGCYVEPYTPPPQQAQAQPAQPPQQQPGQPGYAEQPPPPPPASSWQGTPTTPPPVAQPAPPPASSWQGTPTTPPRTAARVDLAGGADDAAPRSDVQRPDLRRRQRRGRGQQRPVDRRLLQRPRAPRQLVQRPDVRLGVRAPLPFVPAVFERPLGLHGLRLHLGVGRSVRLGDRSLRPLGVGQPLGLAP